MGRFKELSFRDKMDHAFSDMKRVAENPGFVDWEIYKARTARCHGCPSRKGITCEECGCFIHLAAAFVAKDCPKKLW